MAERTKTVVVSITFKFKGFIHPEMIILLSFAHPQVIELQYGFFRTLVFHCQSNSGLESTWSVKDRIKMFRWTILILSCQNNSTQNVLTLNASLEESTAQTPYPALQSMFAGNSVALRMGRSCLGTRSSDWQKPPQRPLRVSGKIAKREWRKSQA